MPCLLDNLRLLEAAQGYAELGLYMQSNYELERMTAETRYWPEVLAVKLAIFAGLALWEMVEVVAMQLMDRAMGDQRWLMMASRARNETRAARLRDRAIMAAGMKAERLTFV